MAWFNVIKGFVPGLHEIDKTLPLKDLSQEVHRGDIVKASYSSDFPQGCFEIASENEQANAAMLYIALQDYTDTQAGMAGTAWFDAATHKGVKPKIPTITGVAVNVAGEYETDQFELDGLYGANEGTALVVGGDGKLKAVDSAGGTIVGYLTKAPHYRWVNNANNMRGDKVLVIRYSCVKFGKSAGGDVPTNLRYPYFYWCKTVLGEDVEFETMDYTIDASKYAQFQSWYAASALTEAMDESAVDNFSAWYRYYDGGDDEAVGLLYQEYKDWLTRNNLVDESTRAVTLTARAADLHKVTATLPAGTNFWVYSGDEDVFHHWLTTVKHVTKIPSDTRSTFDAWYADNYTNDKYVDKTTLTTITSGAQNAPVDGAVYGGTYVDTEIWTTTLAQHATITLHNLNMTGTVNKCTPIYLKPEDYTDNQYNVIVEGSDNVLKGPRGMGIFTSTAYNTLRGRYTGLNNFETPVLTLIHDPVTASEYDALRGLYYISDIVLNITNGTGTTHELDMTHVIADGEATVSTDGGTVTVYKSNGGIAYVDLGYACPGAAITTTSTPSTGYILSGYTVNGTFIEGELTEASLVKFPSSGTVSIQPVFVLSDSAKNGSFALLSDIHLRADDYQGGLEDFQRTVAMLENNADVTDCFISGDIGYSHDDAERELFKGYVAGKRVAYHATVGNHDANVSDDDWQDDIGNSKSCVIEKFGLVFILLALKQSTACQNVTDPYDEDTLTWFEETLETYANKPVVVITHFPLTNESTVAEEKFAGMGGYTTYGFSAAEPQSNRILADLKAHGHAIHVSGHTHFQFQEEASCSKINVSGFDDYPNVHLVHTPSLAYPRYYDGTVVNDGTYNAQPAQGWIVDVYDGGEKIVLNAYDFAYRSQYLLRGTPMTDYVYTIEFGTGDRLYMSDPFDGQAASGHTYTVKLSKSGSVDHADVTCTGGISVTPTTVDFSSSESAELTVTVPADCEGACTLTATCGEVYSTLEFEAGVDIEGTVDVSTFTTIVQIEDGAVYYGTTAVGTARIQGGLTTTTDTNSYHFGMKDLTINADHSAIYIPAATRNYSCDVSGTVTLNVSAAARAFSSSQTSEVLVNGYRNAKITGYNTGTTVIPLKGNLTFRNVAVSVTTTNAAIHESLEAEDSTDIVLEGTSSINFTTSAVSNATVKLVTDNVTYGYVRLMCHSLATALSVDTSALAEGCTVKYYINGSETAVDAFPEDLVPAANTTIVVKAVVTK